MNDAKLELLLRVLAAMGASTGGCSQPASLPPCEQPRPDGGPTMDAGGDPVLLAAGDIALPGHLRGARATAALLDRMNGVVASLGDNVQGDGRLEEFLHDFEPTWGRHRWRTHPAVGNHEYRTWDAGPYYAYFCSAAGTPFRGYYAYELGSWHVIVLNSACAYDEGPACDASSDQVRWLRDDLASHAAACTLAYWHHPRFSSAAEGDIPAVREFWQVLYDAGADVVLTGHSHQYERFAPLSADGALDERRGVREFVVGTGGTGLEGFARVHAGSEVRIGNSWGVLALTLHAASYDWRFVAVGGEVLDSGTGQCHELHAP
jgi:hypothetical protein